MIRQPILSRHHPQRLLLVGLALTLVACLEEGALSGRVFACTTDADCVSGNICVQSGGQGYGRCVPSNQIMPDTSRDSSDMDIVDADTDAIADTATDADADDARVPACGDGIVDLGEECDDGGLIAGDGCDASCVYEWWDREFTQRRRITIDHTAGSEALIDVPVAVHLDPTRIDYNATRTDGIDLRFIDADGVTPLSHDIDVWQVDGDSLIWVRVPQLSAGETRDIWLYHGNPVAPSTEDENATWSAEFRSVWHLNDDLEDASGNNNHGMNNGTMTAEGQLANARSFDGLNDAISLNPTVGTLSSLFMGGGTIEAWIYPTGWGAGDAGRIMDRSTGPDAQDGWSLEVSLAGLEAESLRFERGFSTTPGAWETPAGSIVLDRWHHVVVTYNEGETPKLYINGVEQTLSEQTPEGSSQLDNASPVAIGAIPEVGGGAFAGRIDELRLSKKIDSSEWIATQYRSMTDALLTVGDAESLP